MCGSLHCQLQSAELGAGIVEQPATRPPGEGLQGLEALATVVADGEFPHVGPDRLHRDSLLLQLEVLAVVQGPQQGGGVPEGYPGEGEGLGWG